MIRRALRFLPPCLAGLLFGSVLGLGMVVVLRQEGAARAAAASALLAYLIWIVVETATTTLREARRETTREDLGTLELYALARGVVAIAALAGAGTLEPLAAMAGTAVLVAGVALRFAAIRALGGFYSHRVRVVPGQRVVRGGVYAIVRHPSYLGMLLAHLGWIAVFPGEWAALAFFFLLVPAVLTRILAEERALGAISGYERYASATPRLVPGVW